MSKLIAAYGSNLNLQQMAVRCPNSRVVGAAALPNYRLAFRGMNREGVANIERHQGDAVPVLVWSVTPEDEKALDWYEGYPRLYDKKLVTAIGTDGSRQAIWVYVMQPGLRPMPPAEYYLETILQGYQSAQFPTRPLLKALKQFQPLSFRLMDLLRIYQ